MLTVADLIAKLQEMQQDLPVFVDDWNEEYRRPAPARVKQPHTFTAEFDDGARRDVFGVLITCQ